MQTVKVHKDDLLAEVRANREKHSTEAKEAKDLYRAAVVKELRRLAKKAADGGEIETVARLPQPVDRTEDYDRVIRMLEMSADGVIELSASEFDQYVLDNWSWKSAAVSTSAFYKSLN